MILPSAAKITPASHQKNIIQLLLLPHADGLSRINFEAFAEKLDFSKFESCGESVRDYPSHAAYERIPRVQRERRIPGRQQRDSTRVKFKLLNDKALPVTGDRQ